MFTLSKETEVSYCIYTEQGHILAHVVGLHSDTGAKVRISALSILDFLNQPLKKSPLGFSCVALRQASPFPTGDDELTEDIFGIMAPNHRPLAYVPDYGQGVALCEQLNRTLR